jgi:hypothetical protein
MNQVNKLMKLSSHFLFIIYLLIVTGLGFGLFVETGTEYLIQFVCYYFIPFIISYVLIYKFLGPKIVGVIDAFSFKIRPLVSFLDEKRTVVSYVLVALILVLSLSYYFILGYYPGVRALLDFDYYHLYEIRRSVTSDAPSWFNYAASFIIKAVLPFTILFLYVNKKWKLLFVVISVAFFLGINNMQKSYFLIFYFPIMFFTVYRKKWLHLGLVSSLVVVGVYSLVVITNPMIKYSFYTKFNSALGLENKISEKKLNEKNYRVSVLPEVVQEKSADHSNDLVLNSLIERTVFLPGKIAGKWLNVVPSQKPLLGFGGYRIFSKVMGVDYHDYSLELYPILFPGYHASGFKGSVNVANFMNDYICFGWKSVTVGSFVLAFVLVIVSLLFRGNADILLAVNIMPILMLSSTRLSILLFSGGWGLLLLLSFVLLKPSRD